MEEEADVVISCTKSEVEDGNVSEVAARVSNGLVEAAEKFAKLEVKSEDSKLDSTKPVEEREEGIDVSITLEGEIDELVTEPTALVEAEEFVKEAVEVEEKREVGMD